MKIGIQISSLREFLQTSEGVRESFRAMSAIGYRVIQMQWVSPSVPIEVVKDALDESELLCIGTQGSYDEVIPNLDSVVTMNELWGGHSICVSGIPERFLSADGIVRFAAELDETARRLRDRGKVLVFHPRSQEFAPFGGRAALEIVMDNTDDAVQVGLDLYHVNKAGHDPVAWVHAAKARMEWAHFKDGMAGPDGVERLMPIGQGSIAWQPIIEACTAAGVKWGFAEQERWQKDPIECLAESYEYLTRHGLEG